MVNIMSSNDQDAAQAAGEVKKISVGGQALLEGMLMIGPRKTAIAIRKPDKTIELKVQDLPKKMAVQEIPVVRGVVNMVRQLVVGFRALMFSAEFFDVEGEAEGKAADQGVAGAEAAVGAGGSFDAAGAAEAAGDGGMAGASGAEGATGAECVKSAEGVESAAGAAGEKDAGTRAAADTGKAARPEAQSGFERFLEKHLGDKAMDVFIYAAVALSLCMTIGLFILLPNALASFLPIDRTRRADLFVHNLFEGVIRVAVFIGFLSLSSMMKDIQRVWQYHGAEHKTIHCFEHGEELTVQNIRHYSVKHPRCGTSFLFLVMVVAILVFSVMDIAMSGVSSQFGGIAKVAFNMCVRLLTIPIVAGLAFEAVKFTGRRDNALTKVLSAPGLLFQRFTTREPDDGMIEVAIVAFENAVSDDEKEMAW